MSKFYDSDNFGSKGLSFGGRYLPYNKELKDRAREMRNNMTQSEQRLWDDFLKEYNKRDSENHIKILRQKIIDNYIVDFYIPSLKLVIEIDGEIHYGREGYDKVRIEILEGYGLNEIRFTNNEIYNNFEKVVYKLRKILIT